MSLATKPLIRQYRQFSFQRQKQTFPMVSHTVSRSSSVANENMRPQTCSTTAASRTTVTQRDFHKRPVEWGLPDFIGNYHLNRMTTDKLVPGTAIRVEQERMEFMGKRTASLNKVLSEIESRRTLRSASRTRKAAITARVEVQASVGYRIDSVRRMYQNARAAKKQKISPSRYIPDDEFHTFLEHVESNNVYQVKSRLRRDKAFRLVATAEETCGNTPLHRAIMLGFVEMSRMLLEAGANVDEINNMGDAPIHCCWRFWSSDTAKYFLWKKDPYLMTTRKQREEFETMGKDVETTVELLRLLTQSGADVDLQKNNGQVALHTAARRGPLQAVWVLLFSKATHNIVDHHFFTPEGAAARAGKKEIVALLANWPIARLKYLDSEFVQEWMHFLCDPDANLEQHLTASEVLAQVRMEEHEESTAVRARGGHTVIDEMVTGPVMPAEDRAQAQMAEFSPDTVSLTSTLESASTGNIEGTRHGVAGSNTENNGPNDQLEGRNIHDRPAAKKTKSKLGTEINVFLAQARDENRVAPAVGDVGGDGTAYSRLVAKGNLEGRKSRWPGRRNNGGKVLAVGVGDRGTLADPFGRRITTSQRRRVAALEIADDGDVEGPFLRPATSSVLLTTRQRVTKKATAPHPYYGRRLLTQSVLGQRKREASIKPTATIFVKTGLDGLVGGGTVTAGANQLQVYLTGIRTAFNDKKLLPGPKDPGMCIEGLGSLHTLHTVMQRRKLHERPFCELQGHRKHNEDVYCSTLENYRPRAWTSIGTHEPLLPVRRQGP